MSRTLFDGLNKQTEYESKLAICEHAGESTVPKELTSFSAPPPLHKGGKPSRNTLISRICITFLSNHTLRQCLRWQGRKNQIRSRDVNYKLKPFAKI